MPVPKVTLNTKAKSIIYKFQSWYEKEFEYKSPKGTRMMKGRWNAFLIEVLEDLMSGKKNPTHQEVFNKFVESADKTEEELEAEKVFANQPEKLKTFKELRKEIKTKLKKQK